MAEHKLFYFPYASLTDEQLPLLKVAALYLDKLYLLDPVGATWDRVAANETAREGVRLLREAGILEAVSTRRGARSVQRAAHRASQAGHGRR